MQDMTVLYIPALVVVLPDRAAAVRYEGRGDGLGAVGREVGHTAAWQRHPGDPRRFSSTF